MSKQKPGLSSSHVLGARRKSGEGGGTWRGTSVAADGGAREGAKREGDRSIVALSKQGGGTRKTKLVFVSPFLRFFVPFVRLPSNKPLLGGKKVTSLSPVLLHFLRSSVSTDQNPSNYPGPGSPWLERVPLLVGRAGHDRARPAARLGKRGGAGEEKEEEEAEEEERERGGETYRVSPSDPLSRITRYP